MLRQNNQQKERPNQKFKNLWKQANYEVEKS